MLTLTATPPTRPPHTPAVATAHDEPERERELAALLYQILFPMSNLVTVLGG
jgi:hypothetical protein